MINGYTVFDVKHDLFIHCLIYLGGSYTLKLYHRFIYVLCSVNTLHERRISLYWLKNKRSIWCHLLFYFTSYVVNMFRTLIYPLSGACDYSVELPHWFYRSVTTEDLALV